MTCIHDLTACGYCQPRPAPAPVAQPRRRYNPARDNRRGRAARIRAEEARARIFEQEVTEALEAVETGVQDCKNDNLAPDASESDLYYEISNSIAAMCSPAVAAEVRRRLGF